MTMLRNESRCTAPSRPGRVGRFTLAQPGSLVGAEALMSATSPQPRQPADHQPLVVEVTGPGEWIVGAPICGRGLHIYRVAPGDWLVSEVGCNNEGRAADLAGALAALCDTSSAPSWWSSVPSVLDDEEEAAG